MKKLIIGLVFASFLMAMLGGICEAVYMSTLADGNTYVSKIQIIMTQPSIAESKDWWGVPKVVVNIGLDYLEAFWVLLWWDFPFFQDEWLIVKFTFFIPISLAIIWGFITAVRGSGSD